MPTPQGLYRLIVIGELHGQLTHTAFHFTGNVNANYNTHLKEANALLADFRQNVLPVYQLFCSQEWLSKSILVTTLIPKSTILLEHRAATGNGGQGDNSLPSFCAGLLSLRTGVGGRSGSGRLYIPGVAENLSSNSRLEGSYLGLLANIGTVLLTRYGASLTANVARYGLYSRKLGVTRSAGPPPSLSYSMAGFMPITDYVARPEVATMRKRKLARGQ